eukprot:GHVT01052017.1.p1 GENE.GHVT01052017.1~~GHVT01052017.1.p1  ORF type:complete len:104 (+),score=11.99 GHVT01052017.1:748-1059(+)
MVRPRPIPEAGKRLGRRRPPEKNWNPKSAVGAQLPERFTPVTLPKPAAFLSGCVDLSGGPSLCHWESKPRGFINIGPVATDLTNFCQAERLAALKALPKDAGA